MIVGSLGTSAFALGVIGFSQSLDHESLSSLDRMYRSLQLFVLESGDVEGPTPRSLEVARWLAWATTILAAAGALLVVLRDHFGKIRAWGARDHVLICGLGRCGARLALAFREQGYRIVAVEKDVTAPGVQACRREGIVVLLGHAQEPELLRRAGIRRASVLIATCGVDGYNVDIAVAAHDLVDPARGRPLYCHAHVVDPDIRLFLKEYSIRSPKAPVFRLDPFDIAELGAPGLLGEYPPFDGASTSGTGHIAIVGLGQTGGRLSVGLAQLLAENPSAGPDQVRVTVLDRDAVPLTEALRRLHPRIDDKLALIPLEADVDSPNFPEGGVVDALAGEGEPVTIIYVCLDEDARGLKTALVLRRAMADSGRVPIVVRTTQRTTSTSFPLGLDDPSVNVHIFRMLDRVCTPDVLLLGTNEIIARAIHDEYVRSELDLGESIETNPSMQPWEALPEDLKASSRDQAAHIGTKLRAIGCDIRSVGDPSGGDRVSFSPSEVDMLARMEHERWWKERRDAGWRKAAGKDIDRKESPYLVPWEELPEETREKDRILVRGLPSFLAKAGLVIVRVKGSVSGPDRGDDHGPEDATVKLL